ncbi:MAG: SLC13 family permease [Micavibrio sp.]|nr:SLC13 family permease [Micavibrio sp.]|tara:strand:- start:23553 stop:25451 length:1899 start_codon:yes stop_codon:yes gene_type:complete
MTFILDTDLHMWFVLLLTGFSVILFIREKIPLEVTSVLILTTLMVFGQFFPLPDAAGTNLLNAERLLAGYANPSLIAVLALLVMGQAIIHTDALRLVTGIFEVRNKKLAILAVISILAFVLVVSSFMNNTPLVIIAIPLLQILAKNIGLSQSKIMIPLSYAAILGGMTTLIGSSTNLLVSSAMTELGYQALGFFDFFFPGLILAGVGFIYVLVFTPLVLSNRASMTQDLKGDSKEFVAELDIAEDSKLVGVECVDGKFPEIANLNVKLIQRGGHLILPPFEGYKIETNDIMIVTATRKTLTELLAKYPGFLLSEEESRVMQDGLADADDSAQGSSEPTKTESRVLAEIMISPGSRMIDMSLDHVNFQRQFGTIVLGVQRRARVVRRRLGRIRLEAGDVLLVAGKMSVVNGLRDNSDFIVLSGSKRDLPLPNKAPIAAAVFLSVIGLAAFGVVSIPVAAIAGSVLMIATGCLNIRQATRAIDRKIFLLVGSMLALGTALQATGGATYLANAILSLPFTDTPLAMISVLFLLVAITTNVLTNNACAILFTPIAMNLAGSITVPEGFEYDIAYIFAITVIFGANCSFASPIGYQTNLLVMGPGRYRFRDFIIAGVPLVLLLWATFTLMLRYYYGL